jgi:hypothetical protein
MNPTTDRFRSSILALLTISTILSGATAFAQSAQQTWNFDRDPVGKLPANFASALTGRGLTGQWTVTQDESAPSPPHVLAQTSADSTDYRFPLAIAEDTSYRDLALSVKFKAVSGKVDRAAGLVFRLQDKDNYYVVRANALEDNLRLYHVVKGRRAQFAGANLKVTANSWHEIKVEARGHEFKCYYDGMLQFTARDETLKESGKIGLWTKADSVTYFDDLTVEDLSGARGSKVPGKILAQKLVDDLVAKRPGIVRVGMHLTPPNGPDNIIVASNVAAKVGQKSDPEDLQAMRTGRPVVLREDGNFDITLPLHDSSGKLIGAIGLTIRPGPGEQESSVTRRASGIARELGMQIPSKAKLFEAAE